MTASIGSPRRCLSWIGSFVEYSDLDKSPLILRKWAAISAISAALERKVYVTTSTSALYPNLFVLLVAPPGVGKGVAIARTEDLYGELSDHHYAPSSLTAAALVDVLSESKRSIIRMAAIPPLIEFHSLYAVAPELGVLIPQYDAQMMNTLNDLYDCRNKPFSQRRRTKELKIKINNPQLSILGACTPSFLREMLPDGAWDQGFISRTIMVFSGERVNRPLFEMPAGQDKLKQDLVADLKIIASAIGKMIWELEAAAAIQAWDMAGCKPQPDHPKLEHYNSRRAVHLIKLCMVAAASRGGEFVITVEDFITAKTWLEEAESCLPDLFRSMPGVSGDSAVIDECFHFVYTMSLKEQKPILGTRVVRFLRERVPSYAVQKIIEVMEKDGTLIKTFVNAIEAWKPGTKKGF